MPLLTLAPQAHDALQPAGPQAARIAELWWLVNGVSLFVFVAVLLALAWALWRAPRSTEATPAEREPPQASGRRAAKVVIAGVALSTVLLVWLLVASIATDRALAGLPLQGAVNIRVVAHQWWWQVEYDDPQPDRIFQTANEIRIPVGRPVQVRLESDDVIHSFWVPSLHGKKDLIPGRPTTIQFAAERAGRYRGQCAEFCGLQHAYMAFDVEAVSPEEYEAWAEAQRKPAAEPGDPRAVRGRDLFMSGSCMMCHAIQGTTANARKAPDLTHVASRERLAAGRLGNTPTELAAWITDPQKFKAGVNMPAHPLPADDLAALVAYLGTLK
jgi:cytochrome c oxidase subunit II